MPAGWTRICTIHASDYAASEYRCEYRPGLLSRVRSRGLRSCRDLTRFGDFAEAEELGAQERA